MPTVQMPDGQLVDMPDNPSEEQLTALKAKLAGTPTPYKPLGNDEGAEALRQRVLRGAGVLGTGAVQGALSLPTMAAEQINRDPIGAAVPGPLGKLLGALPALAGKKMPQAFEPGAAESAVAGFGMKPETSAERYMHSGAQGVGAAASMPIGGWLRALVQGGASGLGSEAAAQAFGSEGQPNTLPRVLGGLAGGIGAGVGGSILPQRGNVARELMHDVKPDEFARAVGKQQQNIEAGMPTVLSQTMPSASNLDSGMELLANNRHGRGVTDILRSQPEAAEIAAEGALSKLPGTIRTEQHAANNAQEAATEALTLVKKARTAAVTPDYEAAGEIPQHVLKSLRDTIEAIVTAPGTSVDTIKTAQALGKELLNSSATGLRRTHAMDVKAAIDDTIRAGIKNTINPTSRKTQGELKYLASRLYDKLGQASPELQKANALYKHLTETQVNPMKQSVIGRVAGNAGYQADKEAVTSKIFSLFEKGTLPGAKTSDILDFEKATREVNPEAFRDAAKTWLAEKVTAASKADTARGTEDVARRLTAAFGNPGRMSKEWKTTQDILAGLARSEGKPDNTYVDGFKSLMRLNSEMAIRPQSVRGVTPGELAGMSKDSMLTRMGSTSFIAPLRQPALAIARLTGASVLKDMDKWLTTPEGAAILAQLGKQPYMSPGWVKTLQSLAATGATIEGE